jgi:hypothetical protein
MTSLRNNNYLIAQEVYPNLKDFSLWQKKVEVLHTQSGRELQAFLAPPAETFAAHHMCCKVGTR